MARSTYSRSPMAELGGRHDHDRQSMYDTPDISRHSDQPCVSQDTASNSVAHTEGRGDGDSAAEETTNEDDDEDSSTAVGAEHEDEEDKRPAIRVEPVEDDAMLDDDETASHEVALAPSRHSLDQPLGSKKKRTFSNVSSTSVLFGDDSTDQEFPRRKMARKLSNVSSKPLLTYKESENHLHEHAI
jgi:hypothetical protein